MNTFLLWPSGEPGKLGEFHFPKFVSTLVTWVRVGIGYKTVWVQVGSRYELVRVRLGVEYELEWVRVDRHPVILLCDRYHRAGLPGAGSDVSLSHLESTSSMVLKSHTQGGRSSAAIPDVEVRPEI